MNHIGLKFATWVGHHGRIPDSQDSQDLPDNTDIGVEGEDPGQSESSGQHKGIYAMNTL